jgi:lysophospholipase L1-like esterase
MRFRLGAVGGLLVLLMAGLLSGCTPPNSYVALGDSFTAGPLITPQDPAIPGCLRSEANYPTLIAPDLRQPAFRDVSCSGAQTKHMTQVQDVDPDPDNPPQLNGLDGNTRIVTLGIGGNDIGFSEIAKKCGELGLEDPQGSPCREHYNSGGSDEIAARIADLAPKLRAVLAEIDRRSPKAKVFVVGYPAILPETTVNFELCQPTLPVAKGDVDYLRDDVQKRLNATINYVSVAHGENYVDTYTPSIGHDACKPPTVRWVEPVVVAADAAPVHPNRAGMEGMAEAVRATMRAKGVTVG